MSDSLELRRQDHIWELSEASAWAIKWAKPDCSIEKFYVQLFITQLAFISMYSVYTTLYSELKYE